MGIEEVARRDASRALFDAVRDRVWRPIAASSQFRPSRAWPRPLRRSALSRNARTMPFRAAYAPRWSLPATRARRAAFNEDHAGAV